MLLSLGSQSCRSFATKESSGSPGEFYPSLTDLAKRIARPWHFPHTILGEKKMSSLLPIMGKNIMFYCVSLWQNSTESQCFLFLKEVIILMLLKQYFLIWAHKITGSNFCYKAKCFAGNIFNCSFFGVCKYHKSPTNLKGCYRLVIWIVKGSILPCWIYTFKGEKLSRRVGWSYMTCFYWWRWIDLSL